MPLRPACSRAFLALLILCPAAEIPRLTEGFYRVDRSRSRDTGGTGLGLAIVKHVTQRHGAELSIESVPGKGSSFSITFPPHRVRRELDRQASHSARATVA